MYKRIGNPFVLAVVLCLAIAFADCGEGPTKGSSGLRDGRIFLKNDTAAVIDVHYANEELGLIETVVEPGETKDVSQAVLKGGTEVTVKLKARSSPDDPAGHTHFMPTGEVKVTIDGNVTIRVTGPLVRGKGLEPEVNITLQ